MNEYMNQTQNNPKYPIGSVNMPGNMNMSPTSMMPSIPMKPSAQMMPSMPMKPPMQAMPYTEMKSDMKSSYLTPRMKPRTDYMTSDDMGSQPMEFGTQPKQLAPQSGQFGMAEQPTGSAAPSAPVIIPGASRQGPPPVMNIEYIPGFLASIIGRQVRAEFILGTAQYVDRTGVLVDVGVNYFVLHDVTSNNYVMCDLYSVRFVTILN